MSPNDPRAGPSGYDAKGGPTLIQRPTQHEGLRRALSSSFGLINADQDFKSLLGRLR